MKNTKKILVVMLMAMLLTTGCTKTFRDEETKATYTKNILCRPTEEERIEIYKIRIFPNFMEIICQFFKFSIFYYIH